MGRRRRSLLGGMGALPVAAPVVAKPSPEVAAVEPEAAPSELEAVLSEPEAASPDATDRQNLADTVAVSANSVKVDGVDEAALRAATTSSPPPGEPLARVDRDDEAAEAGPVSAPTDPVPGGPKATPMSEATLPPTFAGASEDAEWFLRTGQPVPDRDGSPVASLGGPAAAQTNSAMFIGGALVVGALGIALIVGVTLAAMFW